MSIKFGDKNKINKSTIGHSYGSPNGNNLNKKENLINRRSIIVSSLISLVVGFILLFSFWENAIAWIENLFK